MGMSQSTPPAAGPSDLAVVTVGSGERRHKLNVATPDDKIKGLTRLLAAENRHKGRDSDEFETRRENMQLLKQLFKKMDPAITRGATYTSHGDLELSFKYNANERLLLVKVIRARELQAKDLRGKAADPYVLLHLHPAEDHGGTRRTQVVKQTLNPVYHEIFSFSVTDEDLQEGCLVCQVWDHDVLGKDDVIGETLVHLSSMDFHQQPAHTAWYTLNTETDMTIDGELEVTLKYRKPQTLLVTVHGAHSLTNRYEEGAPNPMVKLQIPGLQHMFETEMKFDTTDPVWEQTFEFSIRKEEFGSRYLVLHAVDFDPVGRNDSLGQVIIELSHLEPEIGFSGRFELADLKNSERLRSKWFQHATVQEFREALVAHACARHPGFIFQKHSGNKMIRVRSKKARAEGKLRLIDGIPVY